MSKNNGMQVIDVMAFFGAITTAQKKVARGESKEEVVKLSDYAIKDEEEEES